MNNLFLEFDEFNAQQHGGVRHKVFSRGVPTSKKQKRTADKREEESGRSVKKSKNVVTKHPTSLSTTAGVISCDKATTLISLEE